MNIDVSIHLMLLFIWLSWLAGFKKNCFNTSHVTLYHKYVPGFPALCEVSIHLMLLFIIWRNARTDFKEWVSIHLMLLFIVPSDSHEKGPCSFQHISCYSLSQPQWLLRQTRLCFNTSHVTLYQRGSDRQAVFKAFQYISCYSLSAQKDLYWHRIFVSIHLMLLFIKDVDEIIYTHVCFNTSHVTLYHAYWYPHVLSGVFQYISCYSLSVKQGNTNTEKYSFNTSHVTLYLVRIVGRLWKSKFQYISCYSLSSTWDMRSTTSKSFNTSHVTLYPSFYRLFFF